MAGAGVFSMDDLLENDMNVAAGSISDDDCIEVEKIKKYFKNC